MCRVRDRRTDRRTDREIAMSTDEDHITSIHDARHCNMSEISAIAKTVQFELRVDFGQFVCALSKTYKFTFRNISLYYF